MTRYLYVAAPISFLWLNLIAFSMMEYRCVQSLCYFFGYFLFSCFVAGFLLPLVVVPPPVQSHRPPFSLALPARPRTPKNNNQKNFETPQTPKNDEGTQNAKGGANCLDLR